jgi:hypothetical protein
MRCSSFPGCLPLRLGQGEVCFEKEARSREWQHRDCGSATPIMWLSQNRWGVTAGLFQTKTRKVKNNAPTTIMPSWTPKLDSVEVKSKAGAQDHTNAALVPVAYALTDEITVGVTASLRICAGVRLTLAASRRKTLHSSMYYFPFDTFFHQEKTAWLRSVW